MAQPIDSTVTAVGGISRYCKDVVFGRNFEHSIRKDRVVSRMRFSAADIQAPAVRQPRTWLYLDPNVVPEFQAALEAKPVDSGENLIVLIPDDAGVFYRVERGTIGFLARMLCKRTWTSPIQGVVATKPQKRFSSSD